MGITIFPLSLSSAYFHRSGMKTNEMNSEYTKSVNVLALYLWFLRPLYAFCDAASFGLIEVNFWGVLVVLQDIGIMIYFWYISFIFWQ